MHACHHTLFLIALFANTVGQSDSAIAQSLYPKKEPERTSANLIGLTEQNGESVTATIEAALHHNPQLQIAGAQIKTARADRLRSIGSFLPSVEASASYTNDSWRSAGLDTSGDRDGLTVGLSVKQPIFQGLASVNRYRAAQSMLAQTEYSLDQVREETAREAARAHLAVFLAREIVEHRMRYLSLVNKQLQITRARMKAGAQSRTGVEQARMRVAQAQVALEEARAHLGGSEAAYFRIVGRQPPKNMKSDGEIGRLTFRSIEEVFTAAHANNPAINAARHGLKAALFRKTAAKGAFSPNVSLEGKYFKTYSNDPNIDGDSEYQFVARIRVPIFAQGTNYADFRRASSSVVSQNAQLNQIRLSVEETISRAWQEFSAAKIKQTAAAQSMAAATLAVKGLQLEYEAGRRTVIDVLNGQRDLVEAQVSLSNAQFDLKIAKYELGFASGSLTAAFSLQAAKSHATQEYSK